MPVLKTNLRQLEVNSRIMALCAIDFNDVGVRSLLWSSEFLSFYKLLNRILGEWPNEFDDDVTVELTHILDSVEHVYLNLVTNLSN